MSLCLGCMTLCDHGVAKLPQRRGWYVYWAGVLSWPIPHLVPVASRIGCRALHWIGDRESMDRLKLHYRFTIDSVCNTDIFYGHFRKYAPLKIYRTPVEKVSRCRNLELHRSAHQTPYTSTPVKTGQQRLHPPRRLRKLNISGLLESLTPPSKIIYSCTNVVLYISIFLVLILVIFILLSYFVILPYSLHCLD